MSYCAWYVCRCGAEGVVVGVRNAATNWRLKLKRTCPTCEFRAQKFALERARVLEAKRAGVVRPRRLA